MSGELPSGAHPYASLKASIFFALAGLMLLAVVLGGFGLLQIRALNEQFNQVQKVSVPKVEMAREMSAAGSARVIHLLRMTTQTDIFDRDAEFNRFRDQATRFIRARETLKSLPMTQEEQHNLNTVRGSIRELGVMQDRVADLLMAERDDEAKTLLLKEAIPLQDEVIHELAGFVQLQNHTMALANQRANQRYQESVYVMLTAAVAALALGGLVIWRVTRVVGTQEEQVHEEIHQAEFVSEHDALTGLLNRRGFEPRLRELMEKWQIGRCHSVLMMDLDGFKAVNDTGGHAAGDALLQGLAQLFVASVRGRDTVARLGGDEFAFILVDSPAHAAMQVAEKIRADVEAFELQWDGAVFRVGASIGVLEIGRQNMNIEQTMKRVDAAKQAGRNRVVRAD